MKEYAKKLDTMFYELVPAYGAASTVAGEIVRAISRILYRNYNDGDRIAVGYGNKTCNAAARYLMIASHHELDAVVDAAWGKEDVSDEAYERLLDTLGEATVAYLEMHPELKNIQNTIDMHDFSRSMDWEYEEDKYECC